MIRFDDQIVSTEISNTLRNLNVFQPVVPQASPIATNPSL